MSRPCNVLVLAAETESCCPSQRHCSKDLDFEILRLINVVLSLPVNLFIGLASRDRSDLVELFDTTGVADSPQRGIFEGNFLPVNVLGQMASHTFLGYFRLSGDFNNQQVPCCFTDTESAKCFTDLLKLAYLTGAWQNARHTLLFGLREKTISEWTFLDFSRSLRKSFIARNAAARACFVEMICSNQHRNSNGPSQFRPTVVASMKAYSKSAFAAKSCSLRKAAFFTSRKSATNKVSSGGTWAS